MKTLRNAGLVLFAVFCFSVFYNCTAGDDQGGKGKKASLTLIEITSPPDKTNYFAGQELNLTGLLVSAYYSDGSEKTVNAYTVSGYDSETMGIQTVTVSYEGRTAFFMIEIVESVTRIEIASPPDKTSYFAGQELDLSGLSVKAFYTDGSEKTVSAYTVSGYDPETMGIQTVTVSYAGRTTLFMVKIVESVSHLEIISLPDKTSYFPGQMLDLKGLTVKAFFSDGSEKAVSAYTVSGFASKTMGIQAITVSYGGETVVFTVNVYVPIPENWNDHECTGLQPLSEEVKNYLEFNLGWFSRYYGTHKGCVAFVYNIGPFDASRTDVIDGVSIYYSQSPGTIQAWKDGKRCELQEAYDLGWLDKEDLECIAYNHANRSWL